MKEHAEAQTELSDKIVLTEQPLQAEPSANAELVRSETTPAETAAEEVFESPQTATNGETADSVEDFATKCHVNRKEWKPVRPNFWIPIVFVMSFVVPFFILVTLVVFGSYLPAPPHNPIFPHVHMRGTVAAILFSIVLSIPSLLGIYTAFAFGKTKLKLPVKFGLWFLLMTIACTIWYVLFILIKPS